MRGLRGSLAIDAGRTGIERAELGGQARTLRGMLIPTAGLQHRAVRGGRAISDWRGLSRTALFEARDLKPTIGLDTLIATAAAEAFDLDRSLVACGLFKSAIDFGKLSAFIRS